MANEINLTHKFTVQIFTREIRTKGYDREEVRSMNEEEFDLLWRNDEARKPDNNCDFCEKFDTKEEAMELFKKLAETEHSGFYPDNHLLDLERVELEEITEDEDGEFWDSVGIWEIAYCKL